MNFKLKFTIAYIIATIIVGVFSLVYFSFVPGVFNAWMGFAFAIPLVGGAIEYAFHNQSKNNLGWTLFRLGITTLVVHFLLKGIYDIALTTFRGEVWFLGTALVLIFTGLGYQFKQ